MQLEPVQSFVATLPTDGNSVPEACGRFFEGAKGHRCNPVVQVVCAVLSDRKVAGSIPDKSKGDFHTLGRCKKAVFACLATDVKTRGSAQGRGASRWASGRLV